MKYQLWMRKTYKQEILSAMLLIALASFVQLMITLMVVNLYTGSL